MKKSNKEFYFHVLFIGLILFQFFLGGVYEQEKHQFDEQILKYENLKIQEKEELSTKITERKLLIYRLQGIKKRIILSKEKSNGRN